tara:strand:- start:272 stop:730 length:459 start_codon:yes stop_codon:yes gene_type:complete
MKNIFSNNFVIFAYFFIIAFIGLISKNMFKDLLSKYETFTIISIEAILAILAIFPIILIKGTNSFSKAVSEWKKFTLKELGFLFFVALFGIGAAFIGVNFVKKNSVSKLIIINILIDILITFIGIYFFEKKNITAKQLLGVLLVCGGCYLIL